MKSWTASNVAEERSLREKVRGSFQEWASLALAPHGQLPAAHHKLLIRELEGLAAGRWDRLMLLLPPGSAKSTYASECARAREQVLFRDLEAQRAALSREQAELFDRLRKELTRTQVRLAELEQDRDRGWDLARWWNQRAHELRHEGLNAQAMVAGFCSREGVDVPNWPDMTLPGLEETK